MPSEEESLLGEDPEELPLPDEDGDDEPELESSPELVSESPLESESESLLSGVLLVGEKPPLLEVELLDDALPDPELFAPVPVPVPDPEAPELDPPLPDPVSPDEELLAPLLLEAWEPLSLLDSLLASLELPQKPEKKPDKGLLA